VLAFDNMQMRGPRATSDWARYEIVLEVPRETVNINFGVLMPGKGTAWFDDLQVEIDGKPYDADQFDFGFESGEIRGLFTPASDYLVRVDDTTASRGTRSLRIEWRLPTLSTGAPVNASEASRRFARSSREWSAPAPSTSRGRMRKRWTGPFRMRGSCTSTRR